METVLTFINIGILIASSVFFLILCISSFFEKENRAGFISSGLFLLNLCLWIWLICHSSDFIILNIVLVSVTAVFGLISLIKFFPGKLTQKRDVSNIEQYDERDTMFARNNIQYYPDLSEQYYSMRPENRLPDSQIHKKPEFGDEKQTFHDHYTTPGYIAAFEYLADSIPLSDGEVAEHKQNINTVEFAETIKDLGRFYGACDIGFVKLQPYHFYSHKGRHASQWGEKTDQEYITAVAIVVPMRVPMVKNAPTSSMIQESAHKYVETAKISNIIAGYIRQFGYRARAHNDGNYEVLCVPAAIEAGLGELGRMGLFMHRVFGPCVRLAVVTTDLELANSTDNTPFYMEAFCRICKKCAVNCPSNSISHEAESVRRNFRHWSILQEQCYSYWKTIGSDCGVCIGVCPFTKPDTLIHRVVRLYISRNIINQKIALFMDDLLYGRRKNLPKTNPEKIFQS